MKLTKKALKQVNNLETRLRLALLFKVTERHVTNLIEKNKSFGPLVSPGALDIIREDTKLKDSEILDVQKTAV